MSEYILSEDLAVWFGKKKKPKGSKQPKGPWVNICRKDKDGKHPPCGRPDSDKGAYPKCRAAGVAGKMSDADKKAACRQKRKAEKKDTQTGKGQTPVMTSYKPKKKKNESIDRLTNLVLNSIREQDEIEVKPSGKVQKSICDSQKFCSAQGKITFGQLRAIVKTAINKRLTLHIGECGVKAIIRLLPWFLPQVAVAGFIGSAVRAANKVLSPALTETSSYKSWWAKTMLKLFSVAEGDINPSDPFSKIFFISDGLMNLMNEESKLKFANYISKIADSKPDDEVVPEYFVENELRNWINQKYMINPPLQPKEVEVTTDTEDSEEEKDILDEKFKVEPKEYDDLYRDDDYVFVSPLTHNASCKYGANTKWCTTNRDDDEMFDEHIIGGVLVYLIIRNEELAEKLGNRKFALYRGWGEGPGRMLVYDELNNEFTNGEQWLSNEFEKIGRESDYYNLINIFNKYYDFMNKPSERVGKSFKLKESIQNELLKIKNKPLISEDLQYHIDNNIPISQNVFRPGSEKYFTLVEEARKLKDLGYYTNEEDEHLLETDLGKFFIYEGERLPLDYPMINEAEYQGKNVELGKPKKGGSKKWYVYVKNPKTGKIVKVSYGSPVMTAKWNDAGARASFAARHQCDKKKDRTKAGYWACRAHKDFGNNVPGRYW